MRTRRTILGEQALLQPENAAFHGQIPTEPVTPLAAAHQLQSQNSSYYVGPLDVPSNQNQSHTTYSEPAYITSGGRTKRRRGGRGPTVMRDVWEQPQEERTPISFNSLGQPNDKNTASLLANFLGTVARNGNNAPLQFKKWAKMPESYKEDMLKIVKLKFEIPEGCDDFIIKSLSDKWRNWKSALRKMHFDPTKSVEEHLSKVPARVEKDQWKELVLYWFSPEGMNASARNTNNRKRQKSIHRTGTRSFAVAKEIEREKLGREPTRDDLFMALYAKSNTTPTNYVTGEAIEKSKELFSEGIQGSSSGIDRNNTFSQAMGEETLEPVQMNGLGLSESRGASYSLAMEYKAAFENMQKHCGELNKKLEEVQSGVGNNDSPVVQTTSVNHQNRSFASTSVFRPIQEVASSEKEKQYWTKEHLEIFCKLCLEQSEQIHSPGMLFDEQLWRNMSQLLKKLTGENYYGSAELKSKWNDLKEEWQKWKQLIDGEINLRLDPQKNTVDASEEWWRRKIQMNPEFRSFRTKGIPPSLETLLDSMFMNIETRSQDSPSNFNDDFADDSNDDDMRSTDVNIDKIIADLSSKSKIVVAEPIDSSNLMMNREIGQNSAELRLKKTKNTMMMNKVSKINASKKKSKESVKLKKQLDKLYSAVVEKSKSLVNVSHDPPPSKEMTYADFVEMLEEIPEVEQNDGLHFFALDHLKEKMNQVIFKSFKSDEKRVNWLKHEFKKQK